VLTQRSNLTVGPPFDILIIPADSHAIQRQYRLEPDDPYLTSVIDIWSDAQREALHRLPPFPWEQHAAAAGDST
jgi:putative proteasome-type protease